MPAIGPISRRQLISALKQVGFSGPYSGGKHQYMVKGELRLYIPNPHAGDISRSFLVRILQQAGIDRNEWEKL